MDKDREEIVIRCAIHGIAIAKLELNTENLKSMLEKFIVYENRNFITHVLIAFNKRKNSANSITSNEIIKELPAVRELYKTEEKLQEEYEKIVRKYG